MSLRSTVIRRNVICQLSPLSASSYAAITVQKAETVVIENNIISLGQSLPIQFDKCGTAKFLNNTTAGGKLIQGYPRFSYDAFLTRSCVQIRSNAYKD